MDLREILSVGDQTLKSAGVDEHFITSQRLLMHSLNVDKTWIIINSDFNVSKEDQNLYLSLIDRRAKGEPLEYITKKQYFMDFEFNINNNVLIPRYDTECLVEEILNQIKNKSVQNVLDLCTGSGAIAVALGVYLNKKNDCTIFASDISKEAIEVAKNNAKINNIYEKINFFVGDMFEIINKIGKYDFDVIVSNPPYIKSDEIERLSKEVKDFEPRIALDGGNDGLEFYKIIADNAPKYLKNNGLLALEIGWDQAAEVTRLLERNFMNIQVKKDLSGKNRVILAVKP